MDWIKEKIRELAKQPIYTAIAGLVVGLIIGLPILGWGVFPVKWVDADPSYLRDDLKKQYVCMVIDSYSVNKDPNLAATRLTAMGVENLANPQGLFKGLEQGGCNYTSTDPVVLEMKTAFLSIGEGTGGELFPAETEQETEVPFIPDEPAKTKSGGGTLLLILLLALLLLIAGALVYIFFIRNRQPRDEEPEDYSDEASYIEQDEEENFFTRVEVEEPAKPEIEPPEFVEEEADLFVTEEKEAAPFKSAMSFAGEPVAHFMTSYLIGDDLYDDSFSIDAPNGAFLGECGVGISDTIGVGDPKKVTAFEVWLFDKNDIQTVTKVLMSTHAMGDSSIKQRLASKGEPVLLEPGKQILLETATLQLEAKVIEMVYGQGALPTGSFIERLTLELSVWPK
jgi:hypothetical protein